MSTCLPLTAPLLTYVPPPLFPHADFLLTGHMADYQLSKVAVGKEVTKQDAEGRAGSWLGNLDCHVLVLPLELSA